jgi:uncharacterized protein
MEPLEILKRYYKSHEEAYRFLLMHSEMVSKKAEEVAEKVRHLRPDTEFIHEAAMLHDIGIFLTNAPHLGCRGQKPYICHGYLGREILDAEGLPKHALVCERHVGVGLTVEDIKKKKFPLPERDMTPQSLEEIIVCFADKFFSKDNDPLKEKPVPKVREFISKFGEDKLRIFDGWLKMFGYM